MDATDETLRRFTTRTRQLILQYNELKKENSELYAMVDERDARLRELEQRLVRAQRDYDSLKMARMLEITNGDMDTARKRLARLIREVNKCITLLSE
ncbi:MAG: hypothetical protein ACI350_04730 [Prevotella sp.]